MSIVLYGCIVKTFLKFLLLSIAFSIICPLICIAMPAVSMEKVESTPDLSQRDGIGYLPGKGKGYCAPVAVSNSLMQLALNGHSGLVELTGSTRMSQLRLAALLGEARYMNTDPKIGTGPSRVLRGIAVYMMEKGYGDATLAYQGWRKVHEAFDTGLKTPDLDLIKEGLRGESGVWLNLGWYHYDKETGQYSRLGGHWVTLVGYGEDNEGAPDPRMLVIHDPAAKKGDKNPMHRYVRVQKISWDKSNPRPVLVSSVKGYFERMAGTSVQECPDGGGEPGLPRSAEGFYKLSGQLRIQKKADFAILDGAVVLKLKSRKRGGRR